MPPRCSKQKSVLLALGWYVHEINVGVARYAREAGWILDDSFSHQAVIPPGWKGDGVVTLLPDRKSPLACALKGMRLPVVNLCNEDPGLSYPQVLPQNHEIGKIAADELLGRGIHDFAFLALDRNSHVVSERMAGFRTAVEAAGRTFHCLDFTKDWLKPNQSARMIPWLKRQLKKLPKPLAVMAQHDGEAIYLIRACQEASLRVPEDVAVVGVDNDPIYSELGPIPLTSVLSNNELLGYRGAELLDRLMRGEKAPKKPLLIPPGGIIVRRSSNVFATQDVCILKALNFIAAHFAEPIDVDTVVAASGTSRRALYLKFDSQLGRSIGSEILRRRLNHAKSLLSKPGLKLHTVAIESGFESASALSKRFKAHEGLLPSAYREKHW